MPPKGTKKIPCPAPGCNGTGTVTVGDVDTPCTNCDGTGQVFEDAQK